MTQTSKFDHSFITIVSGLPRSGTSMMMQMLESGGFPLLTDGIRARDESNPRGYYEYEKVKGIETDSSWLDLARGKAVKIVIPLITHIPRSFDYKVIFMERDIGEVLVSQRSMVERQGADSTGIDEGRLGMAYINAIGRAKIHLKDNKIPVLFTSYVDVLENPLKQAGLITEFLGLNLNMEVMSGVVDANLYRQRRD